MADMRFRIAQVIDSLACGGAEKVAVLYANALSERGHASHMCATREGGPLEADLHSSVVYVCLRRGCLLDMGAVFNLAAWIRHQEINIVHAHGTSVFMCAAARLLTPFTLVYHDHEGNSEFIERRPESPYKLLLNTLDGNLAVNRLLVGWADRTYGSRSFPSQFLPNFTSLAHAGSDTKNLLNGIVKDDSIIIAHLAHFRPQKDHPTLLRAFALARATTGLDLHLVLIGSYDSHNEYVRSVFELYHELKLEKCVHLIGSSQRPEGYLRHARIGVLSSISEGFPLTILEYGLCFLPVVATDVGACREMLDNGDGGYLVPSGDPGALAHALLHVLRHEEEARAKAQHQHDIITERYVEESVMANVLRMYRSLLT